MGFVLIQSKKSLGLDQQPGSPLAKALDQVVAQYLAGVPDGSGREGALRPFDPDRDLLVITTDPSAPASVRAGLATLIRAGGSGAPIKGRDPREATSPWLRDPAMPRA